MADAVNVVFERTRARNLRAAVAAETPEQQRLESRVEVMA
jgi:hypothetical protein